MIKIDIEEIFELYERIANINRPDFMDIEFCSDGVPLNINPKIKEQFLLTGLNNMDFITSNYYLMEPFKGAKNE
jgi:hypothetical protein